MEKKKIAIVGAEIFDGEEKLGKRNVIIEDGKIAAISKTLPADVEIVNAEGCTLLPGLIDAHTHTSADSLQDAIRFGVTTELEMQGSMTQKGRALQLKNISDAADVRSSGMALTAPGGHPDELVPKEEGIPSFILKKMEKMTEEERLQFIESFQQREQDEAEDFDLNTTEGSRKFVRHQIKQGADYIKIMIEEGTVMNAPGLPMVRKEVMRAAVEEAHLHGKIVIAHALTTDATLTAIEIGVDGLAHLFIDRPVYTNELVSEIAKRGIFITPCLVLNASILGNTACHIAHDPRVETKLSADWKMTMCSCFNTFPSGNMQDSFDNVKDLKKAGVDILAGTDVSVPMAHLGGLAHGVSVHHEMQLLVEAGFTAQEALTAATLTIAKRFSLTDRGRIAIGLRADLLLVKGDPTTHISDSLSIVKVWKEGVEIN